MAIRIKYNRVFDFEDVCPGDILIDRQDSGIMFAVNMFNQDAEELVCTRLSQDLPLKSLIERIGFENVENYIKVELIED